MLEFVELLKEGSPNAVKMKNEILPDRETR